MDNQNQPVIKKNYKTFKEAFNALPEATKQHSIRVAEYTRAMFIESVAIELRMGEEEATKQLQPEYERAAYLAGLYHDIGKVLVPVQYHNYSADFDAEETALYKKHPTDGITLARQMVYGEELSEIEQQMILEAMEFHHDKPLSAGFPDGKPEEKICLMALLTGFADYLDHNVTERRSETPFEDVMKETIGKFEEETELHFLLQEAHNRLRRIFIKYQEQSLKIPTALPFVKRKNTRSFELKYRPIVDRKHKTTVAVQAKMYFKDNKDTYVEYEEVKTIINKNKLIPEVGRYFIYEAGDMIKRIESCELPLKYVALELMPAYYSQTKVVQTILQQLEDARMEMGKLIFSMDESMFTNPAKALMTNMERMTKAQVPIMLTNYTGQYLKAEELSNYSIQKVALDPSLYPQLEEDAVSGMVKQLQKAGIEVLAGEVERSRYSGLLTSLEILTMTGPMAGDYITEDELILGELQLLLGK